MDNHLCASWCWEQKINPEYQYGIFHIDRHYDLLNNLSDAYLRTNHDRLTGVTTQSPLQHELVNRTR